MSRLARLCGWHRPLSRILRQKKKTTQREREKQERIFNGTFLALTFLHCWISRTLHRFLSRFPLIRTIWCIFSGTISRTFPPSDVFAVVVCRFCSDPGLLSSLFSAACCLHTAREIFFRVRGRRWGSSIKFIDFFLVSPCTSNHFFHYSRTQESDRKSGKIVQRRQEGRAIGRLPGESVQGMSSCEVLENLQLPSLGPSCFWVL